MTTAVAGGADVTWEYISRLKEKKRPKCIWSFYKLNFLSLKEKERKYYQYNFMHTLVPPQNPLSCCTGLVVADHLVFHFGMTHVFEEIFNTHDANLVSQELWNQGRLDLGKTGQVTTMRMIRYASKHINAPNNFVLALNVN